MGVADTAPNLIVVDRTVRAYVSRFAGEWALLLLLLLLLLLILAKTELCFTSRSQTLKVMNRRGLIATL